MLRLILIAVGAVIAVHGALAFVPMSWAKTAASVFIDAETLESLWPQSELAIYGMRASLSAYVWLGLSALVAASDPHKYRGFVDIAIAGLLVMSALCLVAGVMGGIPGLWYVGDAVFCFVPAVLLLLFRNKKGQTVTVPNKAMQATAQ